MFDDRIYETQLFEQVRFAMYGIELLDKETNAKFLGYHVQNILNAAANVNKLLFNSYDKKIIKKRCENLRPKYDIRNYEKEYPTLSCNTVRNNNEHFDERLDEISGIVDNGIICKFTLFSITASEGTFKEKDKTYVLKHYDHPSRTFYNLTKGFEQHSINFMKMLAELQMLDNLMWEKNRTPFMESRYIP